MAAALTAPGAPFEHPAALPEMTWKAQPTEGHVTGTVVLKDGTPLDNVTVTLMPVDGGQTIIRKSDGSGWFGFAHVEPGQYLARIDRPAGVDGQPTTYVVVEPGEISTATFRNLEAAS